MNPFVASLTKLLKAHSELSHEWSKLEEPLDIYIVNKLYPAGLPDFEQLGRLLQDMKDEIIEVIAP